MTKAIYKIIKQIATLHYHEARNDTRNTMDKKRFHITVTGRVQGVFYRQSTQEQALHLKLTGLVRNLANGNVEIIAEGERENLETLLKWCHHGPPQAEVSSCIFTEIEASNEFTSFEIRS